MGIASLEDKFLQKLLTMREEVLYKLFLDLRKEYVALNRYRLMEIFVGYGVGLLVERILWNYWDHLSMLDRAVRYNGTLFKNHLGFIQGYPSPHPPSLT